MLETYQNNVIPKLTEQQKAETNALIMLVTEVLIRPGVDPVPATLAAVCMAQATLQTVIHLVRDVIPEQQNNTNERAFRLRLSRSRSHRL